MQRTSRFVHIHADVGNAVVDVDICWLKDVAPLQGGQVVQ